MKQGYFIIVGILTLSFLLMPLLAVGDKPKADTPTSADITSSDTNQTEEIVKLYVSSEEKIGEITISEYLIGVVAAEMPAEYHAEALKAQALASYTYLCRKRNENAQKDYEITDDSATDQGYISLEKRKEKWGNKAAEYEEKITQAVQSVRGKRITYNDAPILAVYHAISPGKTESALNVWGIDEPYLQPTSCVGDLLSTDYLSEVAFSVQDFTNAIKTLGGAPGEDPAVFLGQSEKSESGIVLKINICGTDFTGSVIRDAFALRSAAFDLSYSAEKGIVFSVKGYGHGVGMSQFGANYLAKQGSTFEEIIYTFYKGVKIV